MLRLICLRSLIFSQYRSCLFDDFYTANIGNLSCMHGWLGSALYSLLLGRLYIRTRLSTMYYCAIAHLPVRSSSLMVKPETQQQHQAPDQNEYSRTQSLVSHPNSMLPKQNFCTSNKPENTTKTLFNSSPPNQTSPSPLPISFSPGEYAGNPASIETSGLAHANSVFRGNPNIFSRTAFSSAVCRSCSSWGDRKRGDPSQSIITAPLMSL